MVANSCIFYSPSKVTELQAVVITAEVVVSGEDEHKEHICPASPSLQNFTRPRVADGALADAPLWH